METRTFSWVNWPEHQKLFSCLPDPSRMRFVGGAIRNTLLGLKPDDFDFASQYTPEETMHHFRTQGISVIPTGIDHGTVSVILNGHHYEITTLRKDIQTDGRWACIEQTQSWKEDAMRRDFTINALYVDHKGHLYDDVGGLDDLKKGILRFIGEPEARIQEDYLRILRFFRFWAFYGQTPDPESLAASCRFKQALIQLSGERITKEIMRIMEAPSPWAVIDVLYKEGFFPCVFDAVRPMDDAVSVHGSHSNYPITPKNRISGPLFHSPEVWHAMEKIELQRKKPFSKLSRLAVLCQHMPARLVLSRVEKKMLKSLLTPLNWRIDAQDEWPQKGLIEDNIKLRFIQKLYQDGTDLAVNHCFVQLCFDALNTPFLQNYWHIYLHLETWAHQKSWPKFPLKGDHLLMLGCAGSEIGSLLKHTCNWWIAEGFPDEIACINHVKNYIGEK